MMTMGAADVQVTTALPPTQGRYTGWDWRRFYNAILHVMQNRKSQAAYYAAFREINALPGQMRMTPQILAAGWARFTKLYPGWSYSDYRSAYDSMYVFMQQTGRLIPGDDRQWFLTEQEWQEMEVPNTGPSIAAL